MTPTPPPHRLPAAPHVDEHLAHPANAERYAASVHDGVTHLVAAMARSQGRATTGTTPERAARPVAAVDLDAPLLDTGAALEELRRLWLDDAVWFHEPAYAAHLNCPVVIPALLAEVLVSGVNASLDTFDQSVGATFVERHLVDWTAARIGFGPEADGIFTSGGTQSNLQGLHLARDRALAARGVERHRLRVLTSVDGHFSVQKAARLLGLEPDAVIAVPVDARRRMDPAALSRALGRCLAAGQVPMAVVATAGTTDFGAIDPLPAVAELCETHDAWLHVDAAYGGGLLASHRHRHLLAGIDRADSVTVDFHKTWFQPVSCSAVLVRDGAHLGHVTWHADYLNPKDSAHPNQVDKSLQTTRRFDALKLWMTLRVMGADRIGEHVDTVVELARGLHERLLARPGLEAALAPALSTLVLRYRPEGTSEDQADLLVPRIRAALWERGVLVAATRVEGRHWLKLTLLNPAASLDGLDDVLGQVVELGERLALDTGVAG